MKAGLVTAGGIGRSFLARMPRLLSHVGPVKATSFRVAGRIVNSLHCGHAVEEYSGLEPARVIWLAVPEETLDRVIRDLAVRVSLEGRMIVLCDSTRDSRAPGPLRPAGAQVASLNALAESGERTLVAEGHPVVLRELRRLAEAEKRTLIEMRAGSKGLYVAGVHFASHLVLPWISAAVESLRTAGFSRAAANRAVEAMSARAMRDYVKAGRKAWSRNAADDLRCAVKSVEDAQIAKFYAEGVAIALKYFQ
jgi:hypothetical protein